MPQPVQYRGMALIVPDNDSEWKEFYEHARAHRLVVRKCKACGLMRYPPTHACPWCMYVAHSEPGIAMSRSASSSRMFGPLPPSSSETCLRFPEPNCTMRRACERVACSAIGAIQMRVPRPSKSLRTFARAF